MKKSIPIHSEQGSSLIEIIVSIMIISIISLSFMHYFYQAEQVSATSDRKLIAANLARQIAESYKGKTFTDLQTMAATSRTNPDDPVPLFYEPDNTINGTIFRTFVEVQSVAADPRLAAYNDRLLRLRVHVFWDAESKQAFITSSEDARKRISSTVETYLVREDLRR